MKYVLASASPRRERLLKRVLQEFSVKAAKVDEMLRAGEGLASAAKRLACKKAEAVASKNPRAIVIGADTVAYLGKRNFRKTNSEKKAREILKFLSGKTHIVATGVCVIFPKGTGKRRVCYCEKARVRMKKLAPNQLKNYLKSGEWRGRAGSYDISGKGRALVQGVKGERETVIGLPLKRLRKLLAPAKKW
ncbi:MAG: Maf family protein [Candidatus Micrarchaeota archaeon]|nr:Maf family protein [Candidatus Micrarchaeota archaeon]